MTQDDNNNVRLVARKTTLARIFIKPGELGAPSPNRVEATLHGFPAGSDQPLPESPLMPDGKFLASAPALQSHKLEILGYSANFTLPDEWTQIRPPTSPTRFR